MSLNATMILTLCECSIHNLTNLSAQTQEVSCEHSHRLWHQDILLSLDAEFDNKEVGEVGFSWYWYMGGWHRPWVAPSMFKRVMRPSLWTGWEMADPPCSIAWHSEGYVHKGWTLLAWTVPAHIRLICKTRSDRAYALHLKVKVKIPTSKTQNLSSIGKTERGKRNSLFSRGTTFESSTCDYSDDLQILLESAGREHKSNGASQT